MSSRFKDWYHATSDEMRKRHIDRAKKWRRDNPERDKENRKRYYENNRDKVSEYQREYYKRVRKPRIEAERAKKAVREEEFQNHFTEKLLTYATQHLIIDSFKEPSALPTKLLADCGKNLNE